MTIAEFRDYVAAPERDKNPAVVAARGLLAEYDRQAKVLAGTAKRRLREDVLEQQVAELAADVANYRRENERLRGLLAAHTRAPWEEGPVDA